MHPYLAKTSAHAPNNLTHVDILSRERDMEQVCPRCKTSSYQNPNMKLMVNICGHKLCEACVDSVFTRPSAPCPECGVALRRNHFRLQQFDDSYVEKEVDIRKRILKDYNKNEKDFETLREFNDYLEAVETIIFNLTNGIDVEETKRKVEVYKKENQTVIMKNRAKQLRHEQLLSTQLEQAKVERELRNVEAHAKEEEVARQRKKQKESILDELEHSDRPASEVLASHAALPDQPRGEVSSAPAYKDVAVPSHLSSVDTSVFDSLPMEVGTLYSYHAPILTTHGPGVPELDELVMGDYGYLSNIHPLEEQYLGSGFIPAYACQRSLQEAFSCLLLLSPDHTHKETGNTSHMTF